MRHFSSGGILYRWGEQLEFLVVKQKRRSGEFQWVSPKGHIESGETPQAAAIREVAEEAGFMQLSNIQFIGDQTYHYFEEGEEQEKTVSWFAMEVPREEEPDLNTMEGFLDSRWLPYEEARSLFTYPQFRDWIDLAFHAIGPRPRQTE